MTSKESRYVSMTDQSMSGWGRAKGRINKLVFECAGYKEAVIVSDNAKARGDQTHVHISARKPHYNEKDYLTQYKTKGDYKHWYMKDHFKDGMEVSE